MSKFFHNKKALAQSSSSYDTLSPD